MYCMALEVVQAYEFTIVKLMGQPIYDLIIKALKESAENEDTKEGKCATCEFK